MSIIRLGSAIPLDQQAGSLPNMSGTMSGYFQPMSLDIVSKQTIGFQVVETKTTVVTQGVWQPYTDRQLEMVPEGQRSWSWFWLHALPSLILTPDDVVIYRGDQYRVMSNKNYELYGYLEYSLVKDYEGAGPTEAP